MLRLSRLSVMAFGLAAIVASEAAAQQSGRASRCETLAAAADDASREAALMDAWEAILEAADPRARRMWDERGMRTGEAPGFQVTRIVTRCTQRGRGYSCQIEATLCRM